jgi:two-component system chemotaxis sensor kinase CheA
MLHDESIIQDFIAESNEHLSHVESQLLEIEAHGANANIETVNALFRAVHSIKGAAGFLAFETVSKLSHSLENVLDLVRNRALVPTAEIVDLLLRSCDRLKSLINDLDHSNQADVSPLVTALEGVADMSHRSRNEDMPTPSTPTPVVEETSLPCEAAPLAVESIVVEAVEPPVVSAAATPTTPAAAVAVQEAPAVADANVRVSVGLLDRLMNLAGELVLSRNQLLQAVSSLGKPEVETISARLDQVTSELQEAVMQTRMQPLGNVFSRFPRVVRDLTARLNKQAELSINGKDVEVDKSIIEAIGDPLLHLVRNSLDHGIEQPDVRVRHGKKPFGTISIEASHQAGRVLISVRDDGAGIDPAKLRAKAVAKGIISAEQAAATSDEDAVNLIFHPGFSTAEAITDVSGRGVGMDVVKSNITRLGGTVEVISEVGRGTTILVKLPLTLAIIPSLIVYSGDSPFAISQSSIVELVRVSAVDADKRISIIKGQEVLKLRGRLLPLVRLCSVLAGNSRYSSEDETKSRQARNLDIIVVDAGVIRYGLVVDGLQDSEEIVVKPLGRHLKGSTCLAGATILGDGRVAFILDANGIAAYAELQRSEGQGEQDDEDSHVNTDETQAALVLTNGPEEYFAIPMVVIKRLERVRADQIHDVGGQRLLEYDKETLRLLALDDLIRAEPRPTQAWLYVVVFEAGGREIGLIVPKLTEIRELSTNVDFRTLREPGVIGSLVVDRRTVRLLDVHELAAKGCPQLTTPSDREEEVEDDRDVRIMLVEDSSFFRTQVMRFLETLGHDVVAFEDGQAAWDALQDTSKTVDLVVTDIEMPRMNGFELCRRIKTDARFDGMPVIALTSLAGEDDVAHGREVGIDDYQVKMDRDKLLAAVRRLLPNRRHELLSV